MQIKAFLIDLEIKMYEVEKPNNEVNCVAGGKTERNSQLPFPYLNITHISDHHIKM